MITRKPLYLLKKDDKFSHEKKMYTVFQIDPSGNMAEVFEGGRFWAWPIWNGRNEIMVDHVQ